MALTYFGSPPNSLIGVGIDLEVCRLLDWAMEELQEQLCLWSNNNNFAVGRGQVATTTQSHVCTLSVSRDLEIDIILPAPSPDATTPAFPILFTNAIVTFTEHPANENIFTILEWLFDTALQDNVALSLTKVIVLILYYGSHNISLPHPFP